MTEHDIARFLRKRSDGVSICVRYPVGPKNRGGYFFHFKRLQAPTKMVSLYYFDGRHVIDLRTRELANLVNHCTGRQFDQRSFDLCQREINFLRDEW